MSASPVGLLVVHGIGNQRRGELSSEIASALTGDQRAASEREAKAAEPELLVRVTVGGVPVVVAEANWSALSSPDNPPVIRSPVPIFRDLLETIPAAWRESRAAGLVQQLDQRYLGIGSIGMVVLILLFLVLLFGSRLDENWEKSDAFTVVLRAYGFIWLAITGYFVVWTVCSRVTELKDAPQSRRWLEGALWAVVSFVTAALVLIVLPVVGGSVLFYYAAIATLTGVVVVPLWAVARMLAWLAATKRAGSARTWIHEMGSVVVVLPGHILLQAVRAVGNLFSVVMVERAWKPRVTAVGAFIGIYFAFLLLVVLYELILILIFLLAQPRILKRILPGIDLLLDVANYHLGDEADRRSYHMCIEQAVVELLKAGCKEIHILAHSLGTVLVYDWLKSTPQGSYPIAVLHTIGSPLDKFWYIDHGVSRRRADRQGLRAHVSRRWTNFWTRSDPVSGALDHYDGPGMQVINKRLKGLGPFLVSHGNYWENKTVLGAVRREITATQVT